MNTMRSEIRTSQRRWRTDGREGTNRQSRPNESSGNPQKSYQRYVNLAREAASIGDMIEMENCYQHAEHYFRMLSVDNVAVVGTPRR